MTPQQLRALDFIRETLAGTGISPTYEQLARHLGLASKSNAHRIVSLLAEGGHIQRVRRGKFTSIRLPGVDLQSVPTAKLIAELRRRNEGVHG